MPEQNGVPKKRRLHLTKYWIFLICFAVFWLIAGLLSLSQTCCDWFLDHIHPYMAAGISKATYLIPVPLYELACFAALLAGVLLVIFLILLIFLRKKPKYRRFTANYVKTLLVIAVAVAGGLFLFDNSLQNSSVLGRQDYTAKEHSQAEVKALWNWFVTNVNELQEQVRRDENHHFIRPTAEEIRADLAVTRKRISGEYQRFQVDAPDEKTSLVSGWLGSYGIAAYTVSPSMEIVCRDRTEDRNYFASVYAHEYSHFVGYWREDEANFLGFLLCYMSDDPNIRYAGFMDIYNYTAQTLNESYFGTKNSDEWDYEDPGYLEYCKDLVDFDSVLFICDRAGNYKLYHEQQGEENVVDEHREYAELPESLAKVASDLGNQHWESLHVQLGAHYYDGVTQLIMDILLPENG